MAITKLQSESLNLADDYTFTGTVNGAGKITEADMWRLTANITSNTDPISSNLERVDDASFAKIGTGMSVSSGIWSFPTTGLYQIFARGNSNGATADNHVLRIWGTQNNGTDWDALAYIVIGSTDAQHDEGTGFVFFNVTDLSNDKIKFEATSISQGAMNGNTALNYTSFMFTRIGDSQ